MGKISTCIKFEVSAHCSSLKCTFLSQNCIAATLIDTEIPYTFVFPFFFCLPKVKDQRKFDTGKHDWHDLDS